MIFITWVTGGFTQLFAIDLTGFIWQSLISIHVMLLSRPVSLPCLSNCLPLWGLCPTVRQSHRVQKCLFWSRPPQRTFVTVSVISFYIMSQHSAFKSPHLTAFNWNWQLAVAVPCRARRWNKAIYFLLFFTEQHGNAEGREGEAELKSVFWGVNTPSWRWMCQILPNWEL